MKKSEMRLHRLQVMVNEKQYKIIKKQAKENRLSMSSYLLCKGLNVIWNI